MKVYIITSTYKDYDTEGRSNSFFDIHSVHLNEDEADKELIPYHINIKNDIEDLISER